MTKEPIYKLHTGDSWMLLSAQDVAALELTDGSEIDERTLRRHLDHLSDQSIAEAIHAMLDQEDPGVIIRIQIWEEK